MAWMAPTLQVLWGTYFKPDPAEQLQVVQMTQAALGGSGGGQPLITKRIAVERIKPIFGIENVDAALDEIEKETDARAKRELDAATAVIGAKAGAGGPGKGPFGSPPAKSGDSGRAASGKDDAK